MMLKELKKNGKDEKFINLKTIVSLLNVHQIKYYQKDYHFIYQDLGGNKTRLTQEDFKRFINSNVWDA